MTKRKNIGAKSAGRPKVPAAKRGAGVKMAAGSKTSFKQQRWNQNGGRWRGNNNRDQAFFGLSYQSSQQNRQSQTSNEFSSLFAPSKSTYEQPKIVELGLLIRKH